MNKCPDCGNPNLTYYDEDQGAGTYWACKMCGLDADDHRPAYQYDFWNGRGTTHNDDGHNYRRLQALFFGRSNPRGLTTLALAVREIQSLRRQLAKIKR